MNLEDLQNFVEVADAGGISPAARRLGVAKLVVSRRLFRLEDELGIQLLARNTRGASLTEAGATFRDHAAKVCAAMELARETILPAGDLRGRLRIALPLSFGPACAPVVAELARIHPLLQVHASYSDRFVDIVAEGYDFAIRVGYLQDSNLIGRRIGPLAGLLVASPAYIKAHGAPETFDELARHQSLMQGTETWQLMAGDEIVIVHPQGRFKADNGTALAAAAVAGLGIAALPLRLVEDSLSSGALVAVMTRYPIRTAGIFVVRPPGQQPSRKVEVLIGLAVEQFS